MTLYCGKTLDSTHFPPFTALSITRFLSVNLPPFKHISHSLTKIHKMNQVLLSVKENSVSVWM